MNGKIKYNMLLLIKVVLYNTNISLIMSGVYTRKSVFNKKRAYHVNLTFWLTNRINLKLDILKTKKYRRKRKLH